MSKGGRQNTKHEQFSPKFRWNKKRRLASADAPHNTTQTPSPAWASYFRCNSEKLSVWNQFSPRVYIGLAICLPFKDTDANRYLAESHISESLSRLAKARPDFTVRLQADSRGFVTLRRYPMSGIPLEIQSTQEHNSACKAGYEDAEQFTMNEEVGLPPALFINPDYAPSGDLTDESGPLPVAKVQIEFINGRLCLLLFLHHTMFDGCSMGWFLECFAAQTRSEQVQYLDLPTEQRFPGPVISSTEKRTTAQSHILESSRNILFSHLMEKCPEYTTLSDQSGPTQPRISKHGIPISQIPRTGKIFVFRNDRLNELRALVQHHLAIEEKPTSYEVLSVLTWAHVVQARSRSNKRGNGFYNYASAAAVNNNKDFGGDGDSSDDEGGATASLWNSVNWRSRANVAEAQDYFGNAALPVVTRMPLGHVRAACRSTEGLARLVAQVQQTIRRVDQDYVDTRRAMMSTAPSPRVLGVDYDPRDPATLHFNTWRHFGGGVQWDIPGVPGRAAVAVVRRLHGTWGLGTALILPAPAGAESQELFVSLSVDAMEELCRDQGWMEWVDRVIG